MQVSTAKTASRDFLGRVSGPGHGIKQILYDARFGVPAVVDALYLRDQEAAVAAYTRLVEMAADPQSPFTLEEREVLQTYSVWLDWQLTRTFHFDERRRKRADLLAELSAPLQTRLGEIMRAKLRLQICVNSEGPGNLSLSSEEFHQLYAAIPVEERHSELMYYVAGWAFRHRELPVLEDAFEHFTFYADGVSSDYTWQYVNIMYQLLRGSAKALDVEEYLKRLSYLSELVQFEKFILPEVERQGILNPELKALLAKSRERLEQLPPHLPRRELPTKRIRDSL